MAEDMWQRITKSATRVIHFAQEEAKQLGVTIVGAEHILLGLLRENEGIAGSVLRRAGAGVRRLRAEIVMHGWAQEGPSPTRLTLAPEGKKALEYALYEAREINPQLGLLDFVDTEHILLGLLRAGEEQENRAMILLEAVHIDPVLIREEVLQSLGKPVDTTTSPMTDRAEHRLPTDVWLNLTERAFRVLRLAIEEAARQGTNVIDLPHLALGLFRFNEAAFSRQGATLEQARATLIAKPASHGAPETALNPRCADALGFAFQAARRDHSAANPIFIEPIHLVQGLIDGAQAYDSPLLQQIEELGIDLEKLKAEL